MNGQREAVAKCLANGVCPFCTGSLRGEFENPRLNCVCGVMRPGTNSRRKLARIMGWKEEEEKPPQSPFTLSLGG